MAVELGNVRLEHLSHVSVSERARIVRHTVPGMSGDIIQALGRPAVEVRLRGMFYGPRAAGELKRLREVYLAHTPIDFFAEAVGEGYFAQVLITHLEVAQRAGALDQFDFTCVVVEYVAPPAPPVADPLAALNSVLLAEAAALVDDMQSGLDRVTQLTDLIARQPRFGDPTRQLEVMWTDYQSAIGGDAALHRLSTLLSERMQRLLPDVAPLMRERDEALRGMDDLARRIRSFGGSPDSLLAPVADALASVGGKLAIDVRGITARLPATTAAARAELPASILENANSIERACATAMEFVQHSALVHALPQGDDPHAAAWAIVDGGLSQLEGRASRLASTLITDQAVGPARHLFEAADAPLQPDQYITRNLIGLPLDLLRGPAEYLTATFAPLAPLDPAAMPLGLERQAVAGRLSQIAGVLDIFDPANPNDYDQVQAYTDQLETAVETLLDALDPLFGRIRDLADHQDWGAIASSYRRQLAVLTITPERIMDRTTDAIADVLGDLLAPLVDALDLGDMSQRINTLSQTIRDSSVHTMLRKVRQALLDFLDQIRAAVERVPAELFQGAVEQALDQIRQQLAELGIDQIDTRIEDAFLALEAAASRTIDDALTNSVEDSLIKGLALAPEASATLLIDLLTDVLSQIDNAIAALGAISDEQVGEMQHLIARLEQLSFKPAAEVAIRELDEIRQRLVAMNPATLSRLQKRAIKAALEALRRSHAEDKVVEQSKSAFAETHQKIMALLDAIFAELERLAQDLGAIDDSLLLKPLSKAFELLLADVDHLSGSAVLKQLTQKQRKMVEELEALDPARILDPLQPSYERLMQAVQQIDPERWAARMGAIYAAIDQLIKKVDITSRLDTLEQRRDNVLEQVRTAVLSAVDKMNVPEPLDAFFVALRPLIADLIGALIGQPKGDPPAADLRRHLRPDSLLAPLNVVSERLSNAISSISATALVEAFSNIHRMFHAGLDALDPRAIVSWLHGSLDRLAELGPEALLAVLRQHLPELRGRFEHLVASAPAALRVKRAAILARFDAITAQIDAGPSDSRVRRLIQLHGQVVSALRRRIDRLDFSEAAAAYSRIRGQVERALPDFLRDPAPPTEQAIRAGLAALLSIGASGELEQLFERFLNRILPKLQPLAVAVERLFKCIRELGEVFDPYAFREPIASIFDAIQAKVRSLDPTGLIARAIHDLIDGPLRAIDPAQIGQRLNVAYQKALATLDGGVKAILDHIAGMIDEQIKTLQQRLQNLVVQIGKADAELRTSLERFYERIKDIILIDLLKSLRQMLDNLGGSYNTESDRVHQAFDAMLAAIPS